LKGREPKEISEKNLARVIQARVEEILDYVLWEIRRSGFERKLIGGIVLSGGGALLNHINTLAEMHTGYSTRIGRPVEQLAHGYSEEVSSPIFATAIGLILKGIDDIENGRIVIDKPKPQVEEKPAPVAEAPAVQTAAPVAAATAMATQQAANHNSGTWFDNIFERTKRWFESDPDAEF